MTTESYLLQLENGVRDIIRKTESELLTLASHQLNYKQAPEKWSILECLEHLNRYAEYYVPEIKVAIAKAGTSYESAISYTWIGSYSIKMMAPSNQKKEKTFKRMNPVQSNLDQNVIQRFLNFQSEILQILHGMKSININKKLVRVEFFKILKMKISEAMEFLIVHEQRHLLQALKVKEVLPADKTGVLIL